MSREECELCSQGKKGADGRCGRTIEAQPVSDQTCHIEDVVAAPVLIKPDGFRRWRAVIVDLHILPSPMRSPAALRALPFLGLPRPDGVQPSPHSSLPPWIVSAAVSVAGWKAVDDGTAGFDTLLSSRPIRASSPFDQPAPWLAPQGTMAASCIWCVRRGLDAARCRAARRGSSRQSLRVRSSGHLFPPAMSRGRFQPLSSACVSAIRGIRIVPARCATSKARATGK